MTIEIRRPELEALIRQHMESGGFQDVEEALIHALRPAPELEPAAKEISIDFERQKSIPSKNLVEVCAMVSGLTDDLDFSRNPSFMRPVDLS